jgi:hypothetical protein
MKDQIAKFATRDVESLELNERTEQTHLKEPHYRLWVSDEVRDVDSLKTQWDRTRCKGRGQWLQEIWMLNCLKIREVEIAEELREEGPPMKRKVRVV